MGTSGRIELQGIPPGHLISLMMFLACVATTGGQHAFAQDAVATCAPAVGRVVSLQGNVEVQRAGSRDWMRIQRLDTSVCAGDRLRTGALSRAAMFVQPETLVRVDQNTTITLSQTTTEILVEFFQEDVAQAARDAQSCGAGYFITRFPKKFKVSTPHVNAAVEGTEFTVELSCETTELTVLEGAVVSRTSATGEERTLTAGQKLVAGPTAPAAFSTLIKPVDAVQWVLHYPPLSDAKAEADVPSAEECRSLPTPSDLTCLTQRAEVLLRLGRIEEALRDIDGALALDSANGDANALRAIIQIAKNDKAAALESAKAATASTPSNYRAWLALSYAQQASFELEQALKSARKAQALQASSSLVNARVSELLMSLGRTKDAEASARAAVNSNPAESRAHTMLGFVHLAQIDTNQARADFEAAIERDSFSPLPRLGLGLAMIRDGNLVDGREHLEIAVALDPTNSLLRSYVGKAYFEERRDRLDAGQLAIAKELDPNDPTPWFYDAIRKQTANQPVAALHDMQRSIELNDNRAVYRSRLLLDEDLAARSAGLGRTHRDLGFEQLALVEGWKSVNTDPSNYSGHRLLADEYSTLPRHQIARVNELFQSQLLQPTNITPVQPQLAEANLFILDSAGPTDLAFNEFNPLFNRNRFAIQGSAVVGGNDTLGDDFVVSGISERWSYSFGQFHFETDGFRENNDMDQDILNAFVQFRRSHETSLQAEIRFTDTAKGDLRLLFDPDNFIPNLRQKEGVDSVRLGVRHSFNNRSDLLGSFIYQNVNTTTNLPPTFSDKFDTARYKVEVQHIYDANWWHITSGASYVWDYTDETVTLALPPPFPPFTEITRAYLDQVSAYAYASLSHSEKWTVTIGGSFDSLRVEPFAGDKDRFNPKVGLIWEPRPGTTVRAAAFRTLIGLSTISKQNIVPSLEPTQVARFNQFFFGSAGEEAWRYGVAIDQKFDVNVYAGGEFSRRNVAVPVSFFGPPPETREIDVDEYLGRAYVYWTPNPKLALSAEYQYEKVDNSGQIFGEGVSKLRTHRLPLGIRYFHSSGLSGTLAATFVDQQGEFGTLVMGPAPVIAPGADDFWVLDASIGYRLPKRYGEITLTVNNLLDQHFRFQDTDPENPRIIPERWILFRFTLAY